VTAGIIRSQRQNALKNAHRFLTENERVDGTLLGTKEGMWEPTNYNRRA